MIFKQPDQVLGIKQPPKSQTRRPNFPYELLRQLRKFGWSYPGNKWVAAWAWKDILSRYPISEHNIAEANLILSENVITLPVQPGRGKKSVGRIRITKIRRERLGDITKADAVAEGIAWIEEASSYGLRGHPETYRGHTTAAYAELWEMIYGPRNWWRDRDDDVWVLEFECLKSPLSA